MSLTIGSDRPRGRSLWRLGAAKVLVLLEKLAPFAIIGGLLGAALLVHPKATGLNLPEVLLSPRDRLYGGVAVGAAGLWVVGGEGKILRSDNDGQSWRLQRSGVEQDLQDIGAWDPQRAIAVGDGGTLLTTADGGATWHRVAPQIDGFRPSKLLRLVAFGNGGAIAVGEFQTILVTADYGQSWRLALPQKDVTLYGVALAGEHDVWVAGEVGTLLHSADNAQSFQAMPKPSDSSLNAIAFDDAETGVAVGLKGLALLTRDGGAHWTPLDTRSQEHLFDVVWRDHRWLAAGDKGVFVGGDRNGASEWHAPGTLDSFWHSKLFVRGNETYATGGDIGAIRGQAWHEFKS